MPVLLFAGIEDLDVVRPLAARLLRDGGEVRGYLDDDDYELRNMGCKLAIGALDDDMTLEAALTNVHTFIPILTDPGRLNDQSALDKLLELGLTAARAASGADIAQTILPASTASGSNNALGDALSRVEQKFQENVSPLCILRTGFLWGVSRPLPECVRGLRTSTEEVSTEARVAVVGVEDLVDLVAAADDREDLHGTWELAGEEQSLGELQGLAGEGDSREPGPWIKQILARDQAGRNRTKDVSSASTDFGVTASRAQPLHSSQQARTMRP